jgi:hypothetical protein
MCRVLIVTGLRLADMAFLTSTDITYSRCYLGLLSEVGAFLGIITCNITLSVPALRKIWLWMCGKQEPKSNFAGNRSLYPRDSWTARPVLSAFNLGQTPSAEAVIDAVYLPPPYQLIETRRDDQKMPMDPPNVPLPVYMP